MVLPRLIRWCRLWPSLCVCVCECVCVGTSRSERLCICLFPGRVPTFQPGGPTRRQEVRSEVIIMSSSWDREWERRSCVAQVRHTSSHSPHGRDSNMWRVNKQDSAWDTCEELKVNFSPVCQELTNYWQHARQQESKTHDSLLLMSEKAVGIHTFIQSTSSVPQPANMSCSCFSLQCVKKYLSWNGSIQKGHKGKFEGRELIKRRGKKRKTVSSAPHIFIFTFIFQILLQSVLFSWSTEESDFFGPRAVL